MIHTLGKSDSNKVRGLISLVFFEEHNVPPLGSDHTHLVSIALIPSQNLQTSRPMLSGFFVSSRSGSACSKWSLFTCTSLRKAALLSWCCTTLMTSCATEKVEKEITLAPEAPAKNAKPTFSLAPTTFSLQLLHTSDNESDLLGTGALRALSDGNDDPTSAVTRLGGVARAKSLIEALVKSSSTSSLLLAAGDTMMPAPELKALIQKKRGRGGE
ncbi:MAG: hypothetical protein GY822_03335 [Deltaproteobacteria bacterium]|nr:hypothetical protein [Deltaproteobacteria bacterium]